MIRYKWFHRNHIVLNAGKSHYTLTGKKSHYDKIVLNWVKLKCSNDEKLLVP